MNKQELTILMKSIISMYGQRVQCEWLLPDGCEYMKTSMEVDGNFLIDVERGNIRNISISSNANSGIKSGIELISKERCEQITKHGWSLKDDQSYSDEQLLKAALFCIDQKRFEWPFGWLAMFRDKIIRKDRIQQLTVAGALIAAEIDRIQNK